MAEPRLRLVGGIEDLGSGDPVNPVDQEKTTGRKRLPGLQDYRIDTAPPPTSVVYGGLARKLELRCLMLQRVWADDHGSENFPMPIISTLLELGMEDSSRNRKAVWRILNVRFVNDGFLAVVHHGRPGLTRNANLYRVVR